MEQQGSEELALTSPIQPVNSWHAMRGGSTINIIVGMVGMEWDCGRCSMLTLRSIGAAALGVRVWKNDVIVSE